MKIAAVNSTESRQSAPRRNEQIICSGAPLGYWIGDAGTIASDVAAIDAVLETSAAPVFVVETTDTIGVTHRGEALIGSMKPPAPAAALALRAFAPSFDPSQFGDPAYRSAYGLRYAYVAGEMANAIASVELVTAMGQAGMIGFFGAAGLDADRIESAIVRIQSELGDRPFGSNLIHSPHDPRLENATVDVYLRRGVRNVCASAYLGLTPAVVRYRAAGMSRGRDGSAVAENRLIAKVSRVEVARHFLSPPPEKLLYDLVSSGRITAEQAALAAQVPLCDDLTAEADSGGHTDNRPAITLIPTMIALRNELAAQFGYAAPPRIGAAGGIATPASVAAAFALGAAYVVTGSINQACLEAGTSDAVRTMLAEAGQADVMMAPAADMFEMGVNVQVLKRGTMFGVRARKLYELYRACASLDAIPADQRATLERDYFKTDLGSAWEATRAYFQTRDPSQTDRAEREPRHKMALLFRAYLGQSSKWANSGDPSRRQDYQIWCGPAMGAFNQWARGSFLEHAKNRNAVTIALNLLYGAAKLARVSALQAQGVRLPAQNQQFRPRHLPIENA